MFPRIVLHDGRGTFISLSHFCPTAASLLFDSTVDIAIVEAPAALVDIGELDGLDARHVWPPLLRPDVLMDLESYGAWERRALSVLTRDDVAPAAALAALEDATARIASWKPGSGELRDAVHAAFATIGVEGGDGENGTSVTTDERGNGDERSLESIPVSVGLRSSVSPFVTPVPFPPVLVSGTSAVKRWLAARLFGAWIAYQGNGLAATIGYLRCCLETFEREVEVDGNAREAIRRSDLLIVHGSAPPV